jgi:hypothetical protein
LCAVIAAGTARSLFQRTHLKIDSIIGTLDQMELHRMWTEQCDATTGIRNAFGTQQALNYLIGEKLLDFIEAAVNNDDFRNELPAFAARIKTLFEPDQLAAYLAPIEASAIPRDPSLVRCPSDQTLVTAAWDLVKTPPNSDA